MDRGITRIGSWTESARKSKSDLVLFSFGFEMLCATQDYCERCLSRNCFWEIVNGEGEWHCAKTPAENGTILIPGDVCPTAPNSCPTVQNSCPWSVKIQIFLLGVLVTVLLFLTWRIVSLVRERYRKKNSPLIVRYVSRANDYQSIDSISSGESQCTEFRRHHTRPLLRRKFKTN